MKGQEGTRSGGSKIQLHNEKNCGDRDPCVQQESTANTRLSESLPSLHTTPRNDLAPKLQQDFLEGGKDGDRLRLKGLNFGITGHVPSTPISL